jgi:hypothetical protein
MIEPQGKMPMKDLRTIFEIQKVMRAIANKVEEDGQNGV